MDVTCVIQCGGGYRRCCVRCVEISIRTQPALGQGWIRTSPCTVAGALVAVTECHVAPGVV